MKFFGVMAIFILALAAPASAQTAGKAPVDTVIVNGQKLAPDQVIDNFVKSYAAPSFFLGKISRWPGDICPKVSGLDPRVNGFVAQRIRDIAAKASAHVAVKVDCKINVEVVFTPQPQAFMDDIRKNVTYMLGNMDDSPSKADAVATVSHPVQAWYATQIRDAIGNVQPEQNFEDCINRRGAGPVAPQTLRALFQQAQICGITGKSSLIANGIKSEFTNVLVVADTGKLAGIAISPLADYVAMLALSQAGSFDVCQGLPTIANLLVAGCAAKPDGLTDSDAAYLKAVYAIDPDEFVDFQRGDIARRMEKSLSIP